MHFSVFYFIKDPCSKPGLVLKPTEKKIDATKFNPSCKCCLFIVTGIWIMSKIRLINCLLTWIIWHPFRVHNTNYLHLSLNLFSTFINFKINSGVLINVLYSNINTNLTSSFREDSRFVKFQYESAFEVAEIIGSLTSKQGLPWSTAKTK